MEKSLNWEIIEELFTIAERTDIIQSNINLDFQKDADIRKLHEQFSRKAPIESLPNKTLSKTTVNRIIDLTVDRIILLNTGIAKSGNLGRMYYDCQKELFLLEILNTLNQTRATLFIAERLVVKSKKYFFLQITFQAYRIIYTIKNKTGPYSEEKKASLAFLKYLKYYEIEKRIELARNELFLHYNKSQAKNAKLIKKCDSIIKEFEEHENIIPSFYFHMYFYFVKYVKHLNENDNDSVYKNAVTAVRWFNQLPFNYLPGKLIFTYVQIVYCIQKKLFNDGISLILNAYKFVPGGTSHWFRLKENHLLLMLHSKKYDEACEIFFEAKNNKRYSKFLPDVKQRWLLHEVYIRLLLESKEAIYEDRKKHFNIQKFINDLPTFSADKRAMNIPLLIAQMMFLIIRGDYSKAIDRIEALEKYTSRYLKNDDTFRSSCFIKMLLVIPKQGFNQAAVVRHAQKYKDRLENSEVELIDQPFEIEIIPYENLWEILLNHLSKKHHFKTKSIAK